MATTQQKSPAMPVTKKYAQIGPEEFRSTISQTHKASQSILDSVSDQVEGGLITPVQGAQVASAITGSLFGYTEFHREPRVSDLALLNWQQPENGS